MDQTPLFNWSLAFDTIPMQPPTWQEEPTQGEYPQEEPTQGEHPKIAPTKGEDTKIETTPERYPHEGPGSEERTTDQMSYKLKSPHVEITEDSTLTLLDFRQETAQMLELITPPKDLYQAFSDRKHTWRKPPKKHKQAANPGIGGTEPGTKNLTSCQFC